MIYCYFCKLCYRVKRISMLLLLFLRGLLYQQHTKSISGTDPLRQLACRPIEAEDTDLLLLLFPLLRSQLYLWGSPLWLRFLRL